MFEDVEAAVLRKSPAVDPVRVPALCPAQKMFE
jgi:hypothetical protein